MEISATPSNSVYLMRGLPSCGKSYTAKKLVGKNGVILETDQYFFTEVGKDPLKYNYNRRMLGKARDWIFDNFINAVEENISPIVIDRGNGLGKTAQNFIIYAYKHNYHVELKEPQSEQWQEIKVLLKYKELTKPILYKWAKKLAKMNRSTHRTSEKTIRHRMDNWIHDLSVDDILNYDFNKNKKTPNVMQPQKKSKKHKKILFTKTGRIKLPTMK